MRAASPCLEPDPETPSDFPVPAGPPPHDNRHVAEALESIGDLLGVQGANPFRVAAYRDAAEVIRSLGSPVADLLAAGGSAVLVSLPKIGLSLARTIEQLTHAGTTPLLERLRGLSEPERVLTTVPGVGHQLAARIHERLGVETLADLEAAAWDGRLATVSGVGPRRVRMVRDALAATFRRPREGAAPASARHEPPVEELLGIDEEYRRKQAGNHLPCVAPYRFNPTRATWLPILHTVRGDRHYTALYSNTARAHLLGATRDWVVIYRDDPGGHGQWTVITARLGALRGRRVVRGREQECSRYYETAGAIGHNGAQHA